MATQLSITELTQQLDYLLSPVLSSRRTAKPLADLLAPLPRPQQDFVLHWVEVIDRSNYEMAYQFAAAAPAALAKMDTNAVEAWILQALDTYDRDGLYRGSLVFKEIENYLPATADAHAATFEQHAAVLELYACGLAGRHLQLDVAAEPYTDTETLFLPPRIAQFADAAANFNLYKVIITLLWAQGRYGTFHSDVIAACAVYADPQRAAALLSHFETLRLESRIATVLPGVARDLARLRGNTVDPRCAVLQGPAATVQDSLTLLADLYDGFEVPSLPHHTGFRAEAAITRDKRLQRERSALAEALAQMLPEQSSDKTPEAATEDRIEIQAKPAPGAADNFDVEVRLDGMPMAPPDHVAQLLDSILQDLGEIPDDCLQAAGSSDQTPAADDESPDDGKTIANDDSGAHLYREWDHKRRHYRKDWCVLRELDVAPVDNGFVENTLARYRPQVAQLKRTFEMLRDEDRLLKRQATGDDIDFDALIAGYADLRSGMELPDRLLTRRHKAERDLAALFMVDMSGSTKGWINDAERESLVMLCEALEVLGDRYAIYGFSGVTRKRCEIFRIKRFDEAYDDTVKQRIAGITPQDYTRMGAAIRHLTKLLNEVDARTRLLVTLSDGKPDDYSDHYRGEYGIEDTRQALIEAHHTGIKPFCITIDHEARDYLPHLYGPVNWTLVDNVERLPLKVADIYRRLTA
ncbi:MAG: nitric oxide reductase activation protein NorD [Betaproteobacteria bacterium]